MTNDEFRMTNEMSVISHVFVICHSDLFRHSDFAIRH